MARRQTVIVLLAGVLATLAAYGGDASGAGPGRTVTQRRVVPRTNWPTYHRNGQETGTGPAGLRLRPLSQAWISRRLDGQIYGEPLVQSGRVVIATENDTVYTLAAASGRVLWRRHLARPVPVRAVPCSDIEPTVGITDTPVIDQRRQEIFVEADQMVHGQPRHHLYGLDLGSGRVELNRAVDPPGSLPADQLQRPGLALDHGEVLIAFGGNAGDCGYYHGYLVGVPERGGRPRIFEVNRPPGERQGAIWMGGAAPVVDPQGNIWVATGNGFRRGGHGPYDYSDSVVELSPRLRVEQAFVPYTWASDNQNDLDLGSSNPALVHGLVVMAGKGVAYLLRQRHLGGWGGQLQSIGHLCDIYSNPDGGDAVSGWTVYVPCQRGVLAIRVDGSPAHMKIRWASSTMVGGPPIVAGGLIWTISHGTGMLWGLDPATGAGVVSESLGPITNHFPTPSVGDGLLLAPGDDRVFAFKGPGGLPGPPPPLGRGGG